jgi:hypothetical protein
MRSSSSRSIASRTLAMRASIPGGSVYFIEGGSADGASCVSDRFVEFLQQDAAASAMAARASATRRATVAGEAQCACHAWVAEAR